MPEPEARHRPQPPAGLPRLQRFGFVAIIGVLVLVAAYVSVLINQRQQSLTAAARYNVTWLVSQGVIEVARLQAAIATYRAQPGEENQEAVQLWLDIVVSRTQLLGGGEVAHFIREDPERVAAVAQLQRTVAAAQPLADRLDEPGVADRMLASFAELSPRLTRLVSAAYTHGNDLVSGDIHQLGELYWTFIAVLVALLLCCGGLIATLAVHNRLIRNAHAEVQALVQDLTRTGHQLAIAKEQAQEAMAEVQQQYRALRLRDAELNLQNNRFDAALNNMSQALCMAGPDSRLIVCNRRFLELFGLAEADAVAGTKMAVLMRSVQGAGRIDPALIAALSEAQAAMISEGQAGTFWREGLDGRAIAVSHRPMADGGWLATYEEITERRRVEARISYMAHHDELTDLPNRALFREQMEAALAAGPERGLALLFLDLDHFKNVNDTLGHPLGDALLRDVARRLRSCVRTGDLVARLGGDEFAILQAPGRSADEAADLAQRVVDVICAPYELLGYRAQVGASIGIALAEHVSGDAATAADQMLQHADLALYRAKAAGRRTWRFFEAGMAAELAARLSMEADLREALPRNQLEVMYQPIFGLQANRLSGFEALLRWRHPTRGMVSPAVFIPIMEETGLIEAVGRWVLEQATREAATWPAPLKVAVNLSPLQFRAADIATSMLHVLGQSGLAPQRLELEITESALLQSDGGVAEVLQAFRGTGIRTSLDDFGTRYSSLSYLLSFPFDKIKIDQSFVREMATRPECVAIVTSVAHLANQLGMATTAEGVETAEQLRRVREAGCTEAQGYLFGPPESAADLRRWFDEPSRSERILQAAL
ncbi:putative bifunctional diguanylate cyclase/phosphodiesterase [Belnapia moabensis]|uniref:putative bifunctional diguanylate cyclase/phosphodiesterase n=1 Tax=Belnapia moabensis TaxID=365533 RepID=UPI000693E867|nr:EAL domain-containing protein [Belnapia moabensis]